MTKKEVTEWLQDNLNKFIAKLPDGEFLDTGKIKTLTVRDREVIPGDVGTMRFFAEVEFVEGSAGKGNKS